MPQILLHPAFLTLPIYYERFFFFYVRLKNYVRFFFLISTSFLYGQCVLLYFNGFGKGGAQLFVILKYVYTGGRFSNTF